MGRQDLNPPPRSLPQKAGFAGLIQSEELTFYTVQQAKTISQKEAEVAALKSQKDAEIASFNARLSALEQVIERLAKLEQK